MMPVAVGGMVMWLLAILSHLMRDTIGLPRSWLAVTITVTIGSLCSAALILVFAVWLRLEYRLAFRVRNFLRRGGAICFECGYRIDNLGPTSEHCPECGYSIMESKVRTKKWAEDIRRWSWPFSWFKPRDDDEGESPT